MKKKNHQNFRPCPPLPAVQTSVGLRRQRRQLQQQQRQAIRMPHQLSILLVLFWMTPLFVAAARWSCEGLMPPSAVDAARRRPLIARRGGGAPWRSSNNDVIDESNSSSRVEDDSDDSSALSPPPLYTFSRQLLAEAFGTFVIVQMGTASVLVSVLFSNTLSLPAVAAVWGLAVAAAIAMTGPISGAHLNPAVSLALCLVRPSSAFPTASRDHHHHQNRRSGLHRWSKLGAYACAQLAGAVLGSAWNVVLFGRHMATYHAASPSSQLAVSATATAFGESYSKPVTTALALVTEAWGTAVLTAMVFALTHPKNDVSRKASAAVPVWIGATVSMLICTLAPLTQAGMNPARDFGPRLVAFGLVGFRRSVAFSSWWVYVLGPIVGAIAGALWIDKVLYASSGSAEAVKE